MATNPLGGALHHHISAVLDGANQGASSAKGVVNNQRNAMVMGQGSQGFEIGDVEAGVTHRLDIDGLGVLVDLGLKAFRVIAFGEFHLNPQPRELNLELVVGAAVEEGGGDQVVASLHEVGDGQKLRRLPRGGGHSSHATLQRRHPLFKDIGGGVHQAGVDVPEFLQPKEIGAVLGVIEDVGGGLINRNRTGIGGGIRLLASVQLKRFKPLAHQCLGTHRPFLTSRYPPSRAAAAAGRSVRGRHH